MTQNGIKEALKRRQKRRSLSQKKEEENGVCDGERKDVHTFQCPDGFGVHVSLRYLVESVEDGFWFYEWEVCYMQHHQWVLIQASQYVFWLYHANVHTIVCANVRKAHNTNSRVQCFRTCQFQTHNIMVLTGFYMFVYY
eukprot:1103797_1